ncbi:MAG: VOC family protein [Actinomycetota bacterium]
MVDHVLFVVRNLQASRRFYRAALEPLGFRVITEEEDGVAFGVKDADDFAVYQGKPGEATTTAAHVAFVTEAQQSVDAFFAAAMAAGGRENRPPGYRPEYHAGYYAAFVFDPDGNNVEAVHHGER